MTTRSISVAALSLPTTASSSGSTSRVSASISINRLDSQESYSHQSPLYDEDQLSITAMHMYDSATWRMYNRIINERRRRAEIAKRLDISTTIPTAKDASHRELPRVGESKFTTSDTPNDDKLKDNTINNTPTRKRSSSRSEESVLDECIFPLDL